MQIVFIGDNFHEMSNPLFENKTYRGIVQDKYLVIVFCFSIKTYVVGTH